MTTPDRTQDTAQDTKQDTQEGVLLTVPPRPVEQDRWRPVGRLKDRIKAARVSHALTSEEKAQASRLAKQRKKDEQDRQRAAAAAQAAANRRVSRDASSRPERDADIAPVPRRMKWAGIWFDRTIGALPLIAPLLLSGFFTTEAFHGDPWNLAIGVALLAALTLEGGVWKLADLLSRTLLEGDSTISLRIKLGALLVVISGVIFWSADHQARAEGWEHGAMDDWGWVPALAAALLSLIGVQVWMANARFKHRVALRDAGRVDRQAPKFTVLSWILCPVETPLALRHAVRYRIESPVEALEDRRLWVVSGKPRVWPVPQDMEEDAPQDATRTGQDVLRGVPRSSRRTAKRVTGQDTQSSTAGQQQDAGDPPAEEEVTQDAQDTTQDMADFLKVGEHVLIVTKAHKDWRVAMPSVRAIISAVDAHRRETDGGTFNSKSVASDIQKAIRVLRTNEQLLDLIEAQPETGNPA